MPSPDRPAAPILRRILCLWCCLWLAGCGASAPDEPAPDTTAGDMSSSGMDTSGGGMDTSGGEDTVLDTSADSSGGEDTMTLPDSDGDCIPDNIENGTGTLPDKRDSDGDGIDDGVEDRNCDGLIDDGETDPRKRDTDGDGLDDGDEDADRDGELGEGETDPRRADTDGDGIRDDVEVGSACLDPRVADTDGDGISDGFEDTNGNAVYEPQVGETDPCAADTDGDGLDDGCEDTNGDGIRGLDETNPRVADTDGDGLDDGVECVGDGAGCVDFDDPSVCSSDPRSRDTDGDLLDDATEANSAYSNPAYPADGAQPTDPRDPDTDNDGLSDGLEDLNRNGLFDTDIIELDPTHPETEPGAFDGNHPIRESCTLDNLRAFEEQVNFQGDWKLLTQPGLVVSPLTVTGAASSRYAATTLDDPGQFAAFIISKEAETGSQGAASELDRIESRLTGINGFFPQTFETWDGFEAQRAVYTVSPSGGTIRDFRDQLVANILGVPLANLGGRAPAGGTSATRYTMTMTAVFRAQDRVILLGALAPFEGADPQVPDATAINMNNITNASALAQAVDVYSTTCELFDVTRIPRADFMFVVDDTASMGDEQNAVNDAVMGLADAVRNSFLEARWTVTSTQFNPHSGVSSANICGMTRNPRGVSETIWGNFEDRPLSDAQGPSGGLIDLICRIRDPGGSTLPNNCESRYDPSNPNPALFFGGQESPLKCAKLAVEYVQDPSTPGPFQQAEDAALVVIILTDEDEYETGGLHSNPSAAYNNAVQTLTPTYETFFVSTANSDPDLGPTTAFAIYDQGAAPPYGLFEALFNASPPVLPGSASADIGDLDSIPALVESVMEAAGAFASLYRPNVRPITLSTKVVVRRGGGVVLDTDVPQSRASGWDYDEIYNAVVFFGAERPEVGDDFALSYRFFEKRCTVPSGCSDF